MPTPNKDETEIFVINSHKRRKIIDETGKKYGKLTVIEFAGSHGKNQLAHWKCKCDCGNITYARGSMLRDGTRYSCGCIRGERLKLNFGEASFNQVLNQYRFDAKKRGLNFNLTKKEFKNLTSSNCFYCNESPSKILKAKNGNGDYIYNGVDRIDNSTGYLKHNCVPCCKICNAAKSNYEYDEFMIWVKRIYQNLYGENNACTQRERERIRICG